MNSEHAKRLYELLLYLENNGFENTGVWFGDSTGREYGYFEIKIKMELDCKKSEEKVKS